MQAIPPTSAQRALLTLTDPAHAFHPAPAPRSAWLPYLLLLLASFALMTVIGARVGWDTVARNNLAASPKQQARLDQLPPGQRDAQLAVIARIGRTSGFVLSPILPLLAATLTAAVLLAILNFALGGEARFGPLFAVYLFSTLPSVLKLLLVIAVLMAGIDTESFLINNPLGSNPAFYLHGSGAPRWLLSLLGWLDLFTLWQLFILTVGASIVARVSRSKAALAVFGSATFLAIAGALLTLFS